MSNNILKGKKGIIFGALDNKSIAWKVAEHVHAEGAEFVTASNDGDPGVGRIPPPAGIDTDVVLAAAQARVQKGLVGGLR